MTHTHIPMIINHVSHQYVNIRVSVAWYSCGTTSPLDLLSGQLQSHQLKTKEKTNLKKKKIKPCDTFFVSCDANMCCVVSVIQLLFC